MKATKNKKNTPKSKQGFDRASWNFELLLGSRGEIGLPELRAEAIAETEKFVKKWKERTDWLEDPAVLKEALDEYENWARFYGPNTIEEFYLGLRLEQDQSNTTTKAKLDQATEIGQRAMNNINFFTLRLGKISNEKQEKFLDSPILKGYHHFLENLFKEAKHTLSEAEEKILTLKSEPAHGHWVRMTQGFLAKEEREIKIKGVKQKLSYPALIAQMSNPDKKVRDQASIAFNDIIEKHSDTAEAEMNAILSDKKTDDELRGYDRPDASRHLSDDIDPKVVDTILNAVSTRYDISARYYKLKAKLLHQQKLAYHERSVPIGQSDKEMTYAASIDLVRRVFVGLDPEFQAIFDRFIKDGHFDVFPHKGKAGGAFCAHTLLSLPTYIMLNYTNRLNDALTIAHEVGHGINAELQKKNQNALNFGTSTAVAEVASTFMEDFVLEEILRTEKSDRTRLSIAMLRLDSDISAIFRQVSFYRFEQELHETFRQRGYLSKNEIGKIFQGHSKSYMGRAVEQSIGAN